MRYRCSVCKREDRNKDFQCECGNILSDLFEPIIETPPVKPGKIKTKAKATLTKKPVAATGGVFIKKPKVEPNVEEFKKSELSKRLGGTQKKAKSKSTKKFKKKKAK